MEIFSVRADCFFIHFFNDIMSIVQEKMYMDVDDVCAILGVSKAYAYNLMRIHCAGAVNSFTGAFLLPVHFWCL